MYVHRSNTTVQSIMRSYVLNDKKIVPTYNKDTQVKPFGFYVNKQSTIQIEKQDIWMNNPNELL